MLFRSRDLELVEQAMGVIRFVSEASHPVQIALLDQDGKKQIIEVGDNHELELAPGIYRFQLESQDDDISLNRTQARVSIATHHIVHVRWRWKPGTAGRALAGIVPRPSALSGNGRWQLYRHHSQTALTSVSCSHDGKRVAVGGQDGLIRIYVSNGWQLKSLLVGHAASVQDLAWSPDDTRLASSGPYASGTSLEASKLPYCETMVGLSAASPGIHRVFDWHPFATTVEFESGRQAGGWIIDPTITAILSLVLPGVQMERPWQRVDVAANTFLFGTSGQ